MYGFKSSKELLKCRKAIGFPTFAAIQYIQKNIQTNIFYLDEKGRTKNNAQLA